MQYTIKRVEDKKKFKPFDIIFHINSEKDFLWFHDKVAIKIDDSVGEFVWYVCNFGTGAKISTVCNNTPK